MSSSSKSKVVKNVKDEYKMQHTRTTTSVYTDPCSKHHTVQEKETSTSTFQQSYTSNPRYVTGEAPPLTSSLRKNEPGPSASKLSNFGAKPNSYTRTTNTYKTKTTHTAPNKQKYTFENREFSSSIQKSSHSFAPATKSSSKNDYNYDSDDSQKFDDNSYQSDDNSYNSNDDASGSDHNRYDSDDDSVGNASDDDAQESDNNSYVSNEDAEGSDHDGYESDNNGYQSDHDAYESDQNSYYSDNYGGDDYDSDGGDYSD